MHGIVGPRMSPAQQKQDEAHYQGCDNSQSDLFTVDPLRAAATRCAHVQLQGITVWAVGTEQASPIPLAHIVPGAGFERALVDQDFVAAGQRR